MRRICPAGSEAHSPVPGSARQGGEEKILQELLTSTGGGRGVSLLQVNELSPDRTPNHLHQVRLADRRLGARRAVRSGRVIQTGGALFRRHTASLKTGLEE